MTGDTFKRKYEKSVDVVHVLQPEYAELHLMQTAMSVGGLLLRFRYAWFHLVNRV